MDIKKMVEEVSQAAKDYYQGENSKLTDEEYDTKLAYLESIINEVDSEDRAKIAELTKTVSAGSVPGGIVVEHDTPMLSLAKADNYDGLKRYHKRLVDSGAKGFTLQAKLDGLALSAKYSNGKLIQLATRGDGVKGEALNHLIGHKEVEIEGLPLQTEGDFEVRGELYITDSQFEEVNKARFAAVGERFAHSRNAAVGITKRSISGLGYKAKMSFTVYSTHRNGIQVSSDGLEEKGFLEVGKLTKREMELAYSREELDNDVGRVLVKGDSLEDLERAVVDFGKAREKFNIPTDGVVIKPTNDLEMLDKMGYTARYPVAYIAYKYPGVKATTTVEEIIVTVGKTGRLTPQAKVSPVMVDGVVISNITCHNYSWLNEMGIRPGALVTVTRANDVIPAIDEVVEKGDGPAVEVPKKCSECGGDLKSDGTEFPKTLTCESDTIDCPSKLFFYMKSISGRNYLYLDSLGDVALKALVYQGFLKTPVDFFKLKEDEISKVVIGETSTGGDRTIGSGNAKNIINSIKKAKEETDSNKLLASFNLPGVGPNTAKRLINHFGGIEEVLKVDPSKLLEVPQAGSSLVETFIKYQEKALKEFKEMVDLGVKVNDPAKVSSNQEIKGSFSVSGAVPEGFSGRASFVEHLESLGWEYHKSPKKTTDYLFADPEGTTSKVKKAVENGTKIIRFIEELE